MSNLSFDLPRPVFIETSVVRSGKDQPAIIPGLQLFSKEGGVTQYLHFANPQLNLGSHEGRREAVLKAALYKRTAGANVAYGSPVDRKASDPAIGKIAIIEDPLLVGMYVQEDQMGRFLLIQMSMNMPGNLERFVANQVRTSQDSDAFLEAVRMAYRQLPIWSIQTRLPGF